MDTDGPHGHSRRDFAKIMAGLLGGGAAVMSGPMAGLTQAENELAKNNEKFRVREGVPIQINPDKFQRFSSKNIAFNVVSRELGESWYKVGYGKNMARNLAEGRTGKAMEPVGQADARAAAALALAATGWNMSTGAHGEGHENSGLLSWSPYKIPPFLADKPPDETNPETLTQQVKLAARFFGADLVGIAPFNPAWIYASTQTNTYDPGEPKMKDIVIGDSPKPSGNDRELVMPNNAKSVVVMAFEMNRLMIQTSPGFISAAVTNLGYGRMGVGAIFLAEFIRGLGYWAIPSKNDTGLSVPMAIEAGLGEGSRMGLLVTPQFGPSVRLAKVVTNMPLVFDKPIEFGVEEFCRACKKCARDCPSKSIPTGEQTWEGPNECSHNGVKKWYSDTKKCLHFWLDNGASCNNCVAVCPFTKGASWGHDMVHLMVDKVRAADGIWLALDDGFGYGSRRKEKEIWESRIGSYGIDPKKG